jgi:hypothetical protein
MCEEANCLEGLKIASTWDSLFPGIGTATPLMSVTGAFGDGEELELPEERRNTSLLLYQTEIAY